MKNWNCFVIEIFALLLVQVLDIQAGCTWGSGCIIECTSTSMETTGQVMSNLEQKLGERTQCNVEGINLTLREGMVYPDWTVKANWFTAPVKVNELSMSLIPVSKVEVNAFNATAFKSIKKLVLLSVQLDSIKNGIFNGLESLEILNLKRAALLESIDKGVLDVLNQTLKEFSLEYSGYYYPAISINGFTGSHQMPKLEEVKYLYSLGDTISNKSFVGLRNVKTLDLSECQITAIGPGSFDPISNSIAVLKLDKNSITKLPEGLFRLMLPSDVLNIFLTGHNWHCDCDLMDFKLSLMEYPNFVGTFQCNNSPNKGTDVIVADFCDSYVPPPPITTIATYTTTAMYSAPPQNCLEQGVTIKTPKSIISINVDRNDDTIIQVDSSRENLLFIWFSTNHGSTYLSTSSEINCLITERSISINMKDDTAYSFCLMDSTEESVSPLDCISYTKQYYIRKVPWLFDKNKNLVISMVVVACSFSVFAGLAIGVLAKNRSSPSLGQINNAGITNVINVSTFQSNSMVRQQYNLENNNSRPLPRPPSMQPFEEPMYASVYAKP